MAAPLWLGPPPVSGGGPPRRIVSLAPSATEFICAMDACEHLVGVTRFDDYPASVRGLPKVGGFVDPSVEAVASLHPDLVVAVPTSGGRKAVDTLARLNITVLVLPCETLDDVWAAFTTLGQVLRNETGAARESARLRAALKPIEAQRKVRALMVVGHKPLVAAGRGTFLETLLRLAGGYNVVTSGPPYPTLDAEALAKLDPDVIIDVSASQEDPTFWQKLPKLRAVQQNRVVRLHDPAVVRPGPRLDEGFKRLRDALAAST